MEYKSSRKPFQPWEEETFFSASCKFQNVLKITWFQQSVSMTEARSVWAAASLPSISFLSLALWVPHWPLLFLSPLPFANFGSLSIALTASFPYLSLPCSSQCLFLHLFSFLPPSALCSHPLPPLYGFQVQNKRFGQRSLWRSARAFVFTVPGCVWEQGWSVSRLSACPVAPLFLVQHSFLILSHLSAKVELKESGERHGRVTLNCTPF